MNYANTHSWVKKNKGLASECVKCKNPKAKRYEWANISHRYKKDLNDYMAMCTKCHKEYDRLSPPVRAYNENGKIRVSINMFLETETIKAFKMYCIDNDTTITKELLKYIKNPEWI